MPNDSNWFFTEPYINQHYWGSALLLRLNYLVSSSIVPHSITHHTGGSDALAPGDIGARAVGIKIDWTELDNIPSDFPTATHAHKHHAGGIDPITPGDIGARAVGVKIDWSELDNIPLTFPPAEHPHLWGDIFDPPIYTTRWANWSEVGGKPDVYPPSPHTHLWGEITNAPDIYENGTAHALSHHTGGSDPITPGDIGARATGVLIDWSELDNVPLNFPTADHAHKHHTGGSDALAPGDIGARAIGVLIDWSELDGIPLTFPPTTHSHFWTDIFDPPIYTTRWARWNEVGEKPDVYPPSPHTHLWAEIVDAPPIYEDGTAHASTHHTGGSDALAPGDIGARATGVLINWSELDNIPLTFTAADHSHKHHTGGSDPITPGDIGARAIGVLIDWNELDNIPLVFPPIAHPHLWEDISGAPPFATRWANWNEVGGKPDVYPPSPHTHLWAEIMNKAHASSHATGGTDAISAEAIGAEVAGAVLNHENLYHLLGFPQFTPLTNGEYVAISGTLPPLVSILDPPSGNSGDNWLDKSAPSVSQFRSLEFPVVQNDVVRVSGFWRFYDISQTSNNNFHYHQVWARFRDAANAISETLLYSYYTSTMAFGWSQIDSTVNITLDGHFSIRVYISTNGNEAKKTHSKFFLAKL